MAKDAGRTDGRERAGGKKGAWTWGEALRRLGPIVALVLVVLGTVAYEHAFMEPEYRAFLKPENLLFILRQAAPVGILAVGMTFVIISGGIDLSVGSLVALAGVAGMLVMNRAVEGAWLGEGSGSSAGVAAIGLGLMVLGGAVLGVVNGLLVGLGRLAPFIATLGTMAIYRSLALAPVDGGSVLSRNTAFGNLGRGGIPLGFLSSPDGPSLQLHYPIVVFLAAAAVGVVLLRFTTFGTYVRALGDNAKAAEYAAVPTRRVKIATYALMGLLAGVAAAVGSARTNSITSSTAGLGLELDAIAAVVIGGTLMQGGSGSVIGTVVGVLILAAVDNMLVLVGVGSYYQGLAKGLIIIAAVLVQRGARPA